MLKIKKEMKTNVNEICIKTKGKKKTFPEKKVDETFVSRIPKEFSSLFFSC